MPRLDQIRERVLQIADMRNENSNDEALKQLELACIDELIEYAREQFRFEKIQTSSDTFSDTVAIYIADRETERYNFNELWMLQDGTFVEAHRNEGTAVGWSRTLLEGNVFPKETWTVDEVLGGVWISYNMHRDDVKWRLKGEIEKLQSKIAVLEAQKKGMKQTESEIESLYKLLQPQK